MELNHRKEEQPFYPVKLTDISKNSDASAENDLAWNVGRVLKATGGSLYAGPEHADFENISIDSRTLTKRDLFLALIGDNFDGHDYIEDALNKGAAGLIVSRPLRSDVDVPVIKVDDTLTALGRLAAYRRQMMPELRVIAVTGSSGKTTIKEMCGDLLGKAFQVLKTEGNFNNLVGLPLTLLRLDNGHDLAVLEMGMNHSGEIGKMTGIADPDIACIHNIQEAHLGGFGSLEGVASAKGELFEGCPATAKFCINLDDERVRSLSRKYPQKQVTYGRHRKAEVRAKHVRNLGERGMAFTLHIGEDKRRLRLKFMGEHSVSNALAAAAIAHAVGLGIDLIAEGLEHCKPFFRRFQLEKVGGLRIVNDCYNANPSSMFAALNTLKSMKGERKSVAVLGDMLELGKSSEHAHLRLGEKVACLGFDFLIAVGDFAGKTVEGALNGGMTMKQVYFADSTEAALSRLIELYDKAEIADEDWVLVKGSRGMRMETIIEGIRKQLTGSDNGS